MEKRSSLTSRFLGLFRSSASCNLAAKHLSESVQEPIFVSSGRQHQQNADACLPRSRSLPPSDDKRPSENALFDGTAGGHVDGKMCVMGSPASEPNRWYMHQENSNMGRRRRRRGRTKNKKKKEKIKQQLLPWNPYGFTKSSSEDDNQDELFSSDEREGKTETMFSSDSSEFYYNSSRSGRKMAARRRLPPRSANDGFRPVVSVSSSRMETGDGTGMKKEGIFGEKEKDGDDGIPVVKNSDNPQADFAISMLEMIVNKQIFHKGDLEALLHCYLSLNSPHHHPIILKVFSDICEVLFCI